MRAGYPFAVKPAAVRSTSLYERPMKVLVTNDDGFGSPGIKALTEAAETVFDEVVVVAPEHEMSGASHAITLFDLLRPRERSPNRFSLNGRPADCIMFGLGHVCLDAPPDFVISGLNRGPNLGWDVYYSGTVAGAREGLIKGIPAMALSLAGPKHYPFDELGPVLVHLLERMRQQSPVPDYVLNVNIPTPKPELAARGHRWCGVAGIVGARTTRLGSRSYSDEIIMREDPRGRPYAWIGGSYPVMEDIPGTDCNAINDGYVSITPLALDLTATSALSSLSDWNDQGSS